MPETRAPKQINPATYEATLSKGDKVEIGDKSSKDFKPHLKLNRWDGECFIKIGLPTKVKRNPIIEGNKVKWKEPNLEAHFYPLEPRIVIAKDKDGKDHQFKQNALGGFEFEVILKKKPKTNKIVLDIEAEGLKFCYQPPLTQEEIDEGCVCPDNVVGSYAVYHATRTNMHRNKADAKKYKCGKAFHIYRPKATDANGNWVWCDLYIDEKVGISTITVPQDFLDKAVYPVSTGTENFGYEDQGAHDCDAENIIGSYFSCPSAGTAISITAWIDHDWFGTTLYGKCAIYKRSNKQLIGESAGKAIEYGNNQEITFDCEGSPSLEATDYYLVFWGNSSFLDIYYDTDTTIGAYDEEAYNEFPDPWNPTEGQDKMCSIYCTYEEEAAPAYRDIATRFKLWVQNYKDIPTRFKLTVQNYKDIATRFNLWVAKDIPTRFKLTVQNYKDIPTRFKLTVQNYKDITTRFKLQVRGWNDVTTRFLLWVQAYKDIATRFKLTVQNYKDITTRFRLGLPYYKDIATRFTLISSYADFRGFVWDTVSREDPGNTPPASSDYSNYWTEADGFSLGTFFHIITALVSGQTCYFRTCAHNDAGWSYGNEKSFIIPTLGYKDVATRFLLWVQGYQDIPTRFKLTVQAFSDIPTRFKLTVQNYKDIATRFKLTVHTYQDITTRFDLHLGYYKDIATRFLLWVQVYKDIPTRFKLTVQNYKDIATRFDLHLGYYYQDIPTRFKLTVQNYKDITTRFRLGLPYYKDIPTRFKLTVQNYKDIATRFLLWVQNYKDIPTRFDLQVRGWNDITTRFLLWVQVYKDIATRFKLTVHTYQDIATRFKLTVQSFQDIATRFRLTVHTYQDIATRFKLTVQSFQDIATRFKLTVQSFQDIATRFRLTVEDYINIATRFVLSVPTYGDTNTRFHLTLHHFPIIGGGHIINVSGGI